MMPTVGLSPFQSTMRFQGYHADALVGVDVRAAGVTVPEHEETLKHLFFTLRNGKVSTVPVKLEREPQNAHDPNAIKLVVDQGSKKGHTMGYLPTELAATVAPLMDQPQRKNRFHGEVYEVRSFPKKEEGGGWGYTAKVRVEFLSAPGRAPNLAVANQVKKGFQQSYSEAQVNAKRFNRTHTRVGPLREEQVTTVTVGKDKIVQKIDAQRDEVTFYTGGRKVASAPVPHEDRLTRTRWQKLTGQLKRRLAPKLGSLLKKLPQPTPELVKPPQMPQVGTMGDLPPTSAPKLPEVTMGGSTQERFKDSSGTPW